MLEQYYRINEAVGVSITMLAEGNVSIDACEISIENTKLSFTQKVTEISKIDDLKKHFKAKSFLAVNLCGKGVFQKQIELTENITQNNFNLILPNAKTEDFYIQNFISGSCSFVSVIRKTEADKWLHRLEELGYQPLMLSLGAYPVFNIISQLNIYDQDFVFYGHSVFRNEQNEWTSYQYNSSTLAPFPYKIESEKIDERLLIPYAAVFQLALSDKLNNIIADNQRLNIVLGNVQKRKKIQVQGFLVLTAFFLLLLMNFGLLSWLNNANEKLAGQVSQSTQSNDDLQKMNEQVEQKELLLKTLGWEGNVDKSSLIDQLASLMPAEITWKEASVDPVDLSQSKVQKNIIFTTNTLKIIGTSERIIPVNEWIARIKTKSWVKNVQMDSYTFNSELNTGQFTLIIGY